MNKERRLKKPYRTPKLREFGSVRKLTQNISNGQRGDGGAHPANKRL